MFRSFVLGCALLSGFCANTASAQALVAGKEKYVLVIHGGAGTILKRNMTDSLEKAYTAALEEALRKGYAQLEKGGTALDAVEAAVHVMEESPLFNAAKGAVFTHEGKNELDASIMEGHTLNAGAVAGVTTIKSPVSAARAVMEKSEHVMMAGAGAEHFAASVGLEIVDPSYFWTKSRWDGLQRTLKRDSARTVLDHDEKRQTSLGTDPNIDNKFGTVGAAALDKQGHLAAATSTGGMTNKKFGRVGDAPIIGAGTYANDQVAISCTGWGEFFIRQVVAYDLAAQMEYAALPVGEAASRTLKKVQELGGNGGLIALDKEGNAALSFNTEGMYRGAITEDGKITIAFYKD